jgi:ribosomal protein S18 acetylase RimI-like enzyme
MTWTGSAATGALAFTAILPVTAFFFLYKPWKNHWQKLRASYSTHSPELEPPCKVLTRPCVEKKVPGSRPVYELPNFDKILKTLCEGFQTDPVFSHFCPDPEKRKNFLRVFFRNQCSLIPGRIYTKEGPSGDVQGLIVAARGDTEEIGSPEFIAQGGWRNLTYLHPLRILSTLNFYDNLEACKKVHVKPHERTPGDYMYLIDICCAANSTGKGYGSAMLGEFLEKCVDKDHLPCYLEATTTSSRRLYERFGFVCMQTVHLPHGGPPLYLMLRQPDE